MTDSFSVNQSTGIYMPHIHPNSLVRRVRGQTKEEYFVSCKRQIANTFENFGVGIVSRIDLNEVPGPRKTFRAFIHFKEWFVSQYTHDLQAHMKLPDERTELYYDENMGRYWILTEAKTPLTKEELAAKSAKSAQSAQSAQKTTADYSTRMMQFQTQIRELKDENMKLKDENLELKEKVASLEQYAAAPAHLGRLWQRYEDEAQAEGRSPEAAQAALEARQAEADAVGDAAAPETIAASSGDAASGAGLPSPAPLVRQE